MTNSLVRAIGIACAIIDNSFHDTGSGAPHCRFRRRRRARPKRRQRRLSRKSAVAAKVARERRAPNRMPTWNTYTMGNADLAFLSARQYLDLSAIDDAISVVSARMNSACSISPPATSASSSRTNLSEIDLANEPAVLHRAAAASERTPRRVRFRRRPRNPPRKTRRRRRRRHSQSHPDDLCRRARHGGRHAHVHRLTTDAIAPAVRVRGTAGIWRRRIRRGLTSTMVSSLPARNTTMRSLVPSYLPVEFLALKRTHRI